MARSAAGGEGKEAHEWNSLCFVTYISCVSTAKSCLACMHTVKICVSVGTVKSCACASSEELSR